MFNLSGSEIIVILLLALVVLGPEKLPEALRRAGRTYAELKKMSSGFQAEVRSAFEEPVQEMRETADMLRKAATFDADTTPTKPRKLLTDADARGSDADGHDADELDDVDDDFDDAIDDDELIEDDELLTDDEVTDDELIDDDELLTDDELVDDAGDDDADIDADDRLDRDRRDEPPEA